ncbi:hypothetical protein C9J21_19855, partial [Photobacterium phosphoreum]
MSKKIAIVTFHKAHNYGAVLQAYALKNNLIKLGYNVKFYDYNPEWLVDKYSLFPQVTDDGIIRKLKRNIGYILDIKKRFRRYSGFNKFISKNLQSWDLKSKIDYIVIGSDQVWNCKITKGFDIEFFGLAEWQRDIPSFSYAASMENIELSKDELRLFNEKLNNLKAVGVREESLLNFILDSGLSPKAEHNLDPTLLLNNNEWELLSSNKYNKSKDYVLVYENYKSSETERIAKEIAKKLNLNIEIITACASRNYDKSYNTSASPEDFISLFSNAKFIVTTSYHGLAFAINFNKQFVCLNVDNGVNNRAISLLELLDLKSNFIEPKGFKFNEYKDIDYCLLYTSDAA